MIISKKSLPRRTFLRGMGVTMALPLLDAMVPALSALAATAAKPVRRMGFIYIPNGTIQAMWVPEKDGALELSLDSEPARAREGSGNRGERTRSHGGRFTRATETATTPAAPRCG